ncbi:signal recognition particle-docking protein FtsY, partial [Xenorhabdus sp. 5]|nr:signal recognition particle-docking protein FtsY [Xenorhabdus sp. 5]
MAKEKKRGFLSWFGLGRQDKQQQEQAEKEKLAAEEAARRVAE